ncbi:MAG: extracellular solute-binding protein [Actinomycetaceae bacterium]|nr:extracellular solute-binding protein [Actinomycetaceae bacterium]
MRKFLVATLAIILALGGCAQNHAGLKVICSNDERICAKWQQDFQRHARIKVTIVRLPTWEALARIENQPGQYDVWLGGPAEAYEVARQKNLLIPYRPKFAAEIPANYRTQYWFGVYSSVLAFCSNIPVLKQHAITVPASWTDLESPKMRGLVVASSPLTSGTAFTTYWTGQQIFGASASVHHDRIYQNIGRYTHAGTAPARIVSMGEGGVAISFSPYCRDKAIGSGTHLTVTYPTEGTSYEIGATGLLNHAPHPRNAKIFLDYLSSAHGQQPTPDIPQLAINTNVEGNISEFLRATNIKIIPPNPQEAATKRGQWLTDLVRHMW